MNSSLAVDVFESMHSLMCVYRERVRKSLEAVHPELTFNEMRVLMRTGRYPGLTQKDLVEHSYIDKAQMARLLATLQEKGWLDRSPSESDKRVRCLHLSLQGQRLFKQIRDLQTRVATELLHECPIPLQTKLLELLQQAENSACTP